MLKKLLLIGLVFSSTLYAIQNPDVFGQAYDLEASDSINEKINKNRPQEFGRHVPTPENFKAEAIGHNWAILSWESTAGTNNTLSYHLYRNDILLIELPANQQTYKDKFLLQEETYKYEIFSLDKSGWNSKATNITLTTQSNSKPEFVSTKNEIQLHNIKGVGLKIHHFVAVDLNNDQLYFKIKGKDADKFMIHQASGELVNRKYLVRDYNYQITVEVSDGMAKSMLGFSINT